MDEDTKFFDPFNGHGSDDFKKMQKEIGEIKRAFNSANKSEPGKTTKQGLQQRPDGFVRKLAQEGNQTRGFS